jgi:hypothetical protein
MFNKLMKGIRHVLVEQVFNPTKIIVHYVKRSFIVLKHDFILHLHPHTPPQNSNPYFYKDYNHNFHHALIWHIQHQKLPYHNDLANIYS